MLDELLGRAELKERIEALEEEKRHLERRVEGEQERRAEAVTARQAAEERGNRLEDRIAELEDRVERLQGDDATLDFRGVETLRGERLDRVRNRLASFETEPEGALTAMIDGDPPDEVRAAFGDHAPLVARAAPCLVVADDAGLVSAALVPPNPPEAFVAWDDGFDVDPEWFRPHGRFAFALVRSDLFAIGEYEGRERRSLSGFESDVKGDHSKGGFSQGRFERRRDAQIDEHLERCREEIDGRDAERLYVVGQRTLLSEFREAADRTKPVDATGDPEEALDDAFYEFWATRLYRI
ncbi:Vms1/Ankzf1 family peptidyl-tRNA hydrolase [Haladaptatus salinisoli]|uniref:Vms1/Ankzf1 family peptidyl-tRNA hydrolase n=1 Tax=Haladaptatus salinisoli TaxID=2884876 RepID=UPI001D0B193B|nr:Vms1/Ankzf1 family peptidyl-tRNA hydrolase [Haladaptatus salinisoli]